MALLPEKSVSESLLEVLANAGVDTMYGIPGDAINSLVEAVRKQDRIRFIQVRHEEVGALAASAQAKLTGELGVCVGTAGPGAIHLLNGLYDAKLDHAPVLAITGQVATSKLGSSYHQEVDLFTLFKDVSVFNQTVVNPDQLPRLAVHACQAALSHRGVAHLSLPVDIAGAAAPSGDSHDVFTGSGLMVPCDADLDAAADILDGADRVAILAGIGALDAREELLEVAERLDAPIIKTLRAKELIADDHPRAVGGLGLLGTRPAVEAVDGCDALLMVGTDFPYEDFYPEGVPAVQIDLDPDRLGKRYPVTVGLRGHAHLALGEILERLDGDRPPSGWMGELRESTASWREKMEDVETSDDEPIRPQRVARLVGEVANDDAVFVVDTGAVTVWAARNLRMKAGQRFILSSSLASMGFGLPGAIGAQMAYPDRQVIALVGDGSMGMHLGDLVTAVKYDLPVTLVVFDNGKLGLIQMEQEVQGYPEFETHLRNPDFPAVAEACGVKRFSVEAPSDLASVLEAACSLDRPALVSVAVEPEERTMPPKIQMHQALGYGMAKAREFFGLGDKRGGREVIESVLPR